MGWIRRYILFHGKRHPADMGAGEVTQFLTVLAVERKVAASTQNQALAALLFLYREVLEQNLPWLDDLVRARRPQHLPVVMTRDGVQRQHEGDLQAGAGWVELPDALGQQYPSAGRQWGWQWVFPATRLYFHVRPGNGAAVTCTSPFPNAR